VDAYFHTISPTFRKNNSMQNTSYPRKLLDHRPQSEQNERGFKMHKKH